MKTITKRSKTRQKVNTPDPSCESVFVQIIPAQKLLFRLLIPGLISPL